ncbi:hypothetical protein FSP39_017047 [Pinctada imbricata]|uniref:1-acylglycerol-3-phosphate O-acyltransferase ABHD5 n=1 Tax=Pinctada imbricata TaxID=66713 RepID=A0AA89BKV6_PINIB|nr:hypothetical protein FSP39_017047 [Pinctada imbricata]
MALEESDRSGWLFPSSWFSWRPTSMARLAQAELKILQTFIKKAFDTKYVNLPKSQHRIWTLTVNESGATNKVPLVLVHGMGGGIGLWAQNIDTLSANRPLYAFDLLGFGRSSRPRFSCTPEVAELEFVESIEEWRNEMKLDKMVLVGHSLGAYVASSYSLKYPERVKHLVLADPWGFPEKPAPEHRRPIPIWIRAIATLIKPFNPLAVLRAAGPWGPGLVKRFRPDLQNKFSHMLDDDTIFDYIYHCNAQTPSGESAFKTLNTSFGWAKNPMVNRIEQVDQRIPITFIYGSKSWVDNATGYQIKHVRSESFVDVAVVRGAGHHVYADKPVPFNELVLRVCDAVDNNTVPKPIKFQEWNKKYGSPDMEENRKNGSSDKDKVSKRERRVSPEKTDSEAGSQTSESPDRKPGDVVNDSDSQFSNVNLNTSPSKASFGEEKEDLPKQLL